METRILKTAISGADDLAINGATPAFDSPLHVGSPNIGSRNDFKHYVDQIFSNGWLTNNGEMVHTLESRIAEYLGVKHCVAVCNGTIALEIAIRALGMTGEVIVPSFTFIATAHALHWQGIKPVFADIDRSTHTLDPESVQRKITSRTTGIIGVHLWGRPCMVDSLENIASEYDLTLMFDAAHAFGVTHNARPIGNFGRCEVMSFHATKFFNTFEGGAILTNDDELADSVRLMRNFGFSGRDNVIYPGTNGKMTEVAAAMGLVNLDSIESLVDVNYRNYCLYTEGLSGLKGVRVLDYNQKEQNNYQYIVIEVTDQSAIDRDRLVQVLEAENVLARKYFWPGCHNMKPYKSIYPELSSSLRDTEYVAARVVVLPTGKNVTEDMVRTIVSIIELSTGSSA